jgi:hypothetical protein
VGDVGGLRLGAAVRLIGGRTQLRYVTLHLFGVEAMADRADVAQISHNVLVIS